MPARNFSCFVGGPKANEELFRKVLGGTGILPVWRTGWKPVPPKFNVGCVLRTINPIECRLFIIYGLTKDP
jgi:hypothetical protein